VNEANKEDRKC